MQKAAGLKVINVFEQKTTFKVGSKHVCDLARPFLWRDCMASAERQRFLSKPDGKQIREAKEHKKARKTVAQKMKP